MFGMPRASGCKAGHPQYVLEGLVLALHQVPADFGQGVCLLHELALAVCRTSMLLRVCLMKFVNMCVLASMCGIVLRNSEPPST